MSIMIIINQFSMKKRDVIIIWSYCRSDHEKKHMKQLSFEYAKREKKEMATQKSCSRDHHFISIFQPFEALASPQNVMCYPRQTNTHIHSSIKVINYICIIHRVVTIDSFLSYHIITPTQLTHHFIHNQQRAER